MDSQETKIFTTILIGLAFLALFLCFFIGSVVYYHLQYKRLYRQKLMAEIKATEQERKRIAADLHDDVGPVLSLIKLQITGVFPDGSNEQLIFEDTGKQIDYVLQKIRTLNSTLLPGLYLKEGFHEALSVYVQLIRNTGFIQVALEWYGEELFLSKEQQTSVLRIVQEMTTNVLKHAEAALLTITCKVYDQYFLLYINDNGKGINTHTILMQSDGCGLQNIMSRIELLNGDLGIETAPGKGIKYEIKIPIEQ